MTDLFYEAQRIRMVEERIAALYPSDAVQSPVHLSVGQEAVAVGVCSLLAPTDLLFGTYRSHAWYLAKGGDLRRFMAEMFGKADGFAKGKAGSMHLAAPEVGLMPCSAIVASTIPHAVGAALAMKLAGEAGRVAVATFGDGATEQGVFHEALNFAAIHRLPVLFVCEDNGFAVHSPLGERQAYALGAIATTYGMPCRTVADGWDWDRVAGAATDLVFGSGVRLVGGPAFLHVRTCRHKEHVGVGEDDAMPYRAARRGDATARLNDPLRLDPARWAANEAAIAAEIDDAVAFAEASPWPNPREVGTDVDG